VQNVCNELNRPAYWACRTIRNSRRCAFRHSPVTCCGNTSPFSRINWLIISTSYHTLHKFSVKHKRA